MTVNELQALDVDIYAGGRAVLEGFEFTAHAGEVVGLAGPSGCGKTLLLYTLGGLRLPHAGRVTVDGRPGRPWRQSTVAVLAGPLALPGLLSVAEVIGMSLRSERLSRRELRLRIQSILEPLGLVDLADQTLATLSGGQLQRVSITQALSRRPDLLLADEPTTALDSRWREKAMNLLTGEARRGAIVIVASNDPDTLAQCDRIADLAPDQPHPAR